MPHDLNGDGYADVVRQGSRDSKPVLFAHWGGADFNTTPDDESQLSTQLSGSFGLRFAGDLNADGFADLVVIQGANATCATSGPNVGVAYGASTLAGLRHERLCRTAGSSSVSLLAANAGDLNGDGFSDIAVARDWSATENSVYVLAGGAESVSSTPVVELDVASGVAYPHTTAAGVSLAGAGDFDGDGYADFVASASGVEQTIVTQRLYRGGSSFSSSFAASSDYSSCRHNVWLAMLGDVTGDGRDDWGLSCRGDAAYVFGLIAGSTAQPSVSDPFGLADQVKTLSATLDFDGDGIKEVFLGRSGGALIWRRDGFDPIEPPSFADLSDAAVMATADHDGDGRDDVAWSTQDGDVGWLGSYSSFNVVPIFLSEPQGITASRLAF